MCPDVGKTLKLEPTPLAARMRALECTAEDISSALAAHDTPRDAIVESLKLAGFDRTYVARADRQRARVCGI